MSLFLFAPLTSGTYSWFNFGVIGFQPVEVAKLALIIVLAKYFENRHIYIKHYRYIILSGLIFADTSIYKSRICNITSRYYGKA